jgi:hypothetical protein
MECMTDSKISPVSAFLTDVIYKSVVLLDNSKRQLTNKSAISAAEKPTVKTLIKYLKSTFLIASIAAGLMIGSTQQCKAAYYNNYYSDYVYYLSLYNSTHVAQYYYDAVAFYYYYTAGYYGDYYGFYADRVGYKSTTYRGSTTYAGYYYNLYAYYGDYYVRL